MKFSPGQSERTNGPSVSRDKVAAGPFWSVMLLLLLILQNFISTCVQAELTNPAVGTAQKPAGNLILFPNDGLSPWILLPESDQIDYSQNWIQTALNPPPESDSAGHVAVNQAEISQRQASSVSSIPIPSFEEAESPARQQLFPAAAENWLDLEDENSADDRPGLLRPEVHEQISQASSSSLILAAECPQYGTDCVNADGCLSDNDHTVMERDSKQNRHLRPASYCQVMGVRELSPGQRMWPDRWSWAAGRDPWPRIIISEQKPGLIRHTGSLHQCPTIENRDQIPELNQISTSDEIPVAQMTLNTAPQAGPMPESRSPDAVLSEQSQPHPRGTERGWNMSQVHWNATDFTHGPLYFEELSLERLGYSKGYLQPFYSGVKFFSTVPLLPGLMTIDAPHEPQYDLGDPLPGSCQPYVTRRADWNYKAVLVEAGAVLGLSILIP